MMRLLRYVGRDTSLGLKSSVSQTVTMRFVLKPEKARFSDDELVGDLQRVATLCGTAHVKPSDYDRLGKFNRGTLRQRFGSWKVAHERAGLQAHERPPATRDLLIEDLRRVSGILGRATISQTEYDEHGTWSVRPFITEFGNWLKAIEAAGLEVHPRFNARISDTDLFANLEAVWTILGRQPRYLEFLPPLSSISRGTYCSRFGGWRQALQAFVTWVNSDRPESEEASKGSTSTVPSPKIATLGAGNKAAGRTPREINLRLRFRVFQLDRFCCVACGRSPSSVPGLALHVDHILAWSRGGETVLENLQTLCEPCNLGKGDLAAEGAG